MSKKLFCLLSLLCCMSLHAVYGMKKKTELSVDQWKEVFDYLDFENLLTCIRFVSKDFYRIVGEYCKETNWRPITIKLKERLFELWDLFNSEKPLQSLKNLLGNDKAISFDCSQTSVSDKHLKVITGMFQKNIRGLRIYFCARITHNGLMHLGGLTDLIELHLFFNRYMNDQVLEHLVERLKKLQVLALRNCWGLTSNCAKSIVELSELREFEADKCKWVTDEMLLCLTRCNKLQILNINYCEKVTEKGLKHLLLLPNLQVLSLDGFSWQTIKDSIKKFTKLKFLSFQETYDLEDKDLQCFRSGLSLKTLDLSCGIKITEGAVEQLRLENPDLKVFYKEWICSDESEEEYEEREICDPWG